MTGSQGLDEFCRVSNLDVLPYIACFNECVTGCLFQWWIPGKAVGCKTNTEDGLCDCYNYVIALIEFYSRPGLPRGLWYLFGVFALIQCSFR